MIKTQKFFLNLNNTIKRNKMKTRWSGGKVVHEQILWYEQS